MITVMTVILLLKLIKLDFLQGNYKYLPKNLQKKIIHKSAGFFNLLNYLFRYIKIGINFLNIIMFFQLFH